MGDKTKYIIFGLMGVVLVLVFLFVQALNSKQLVLRERDDAKKENASLTSRIDQLGNSVRDYENKIGLLNKELDKASRAKQEIDKRLELVNKEKAELIERLKSASAKPALTIPQIVAAPETQDTYWAGILKAKTDLELQLGNVRSELKKIEASYEELQRQKNTLELDINSLRRENLDSARQLGYNQKLMDSIAQELVRERNDKIQIQNNFKFLKNENLVLTRQIKNLNNQKTSLEKKLQDLQENKARIERRVTEMETMLTDKITQVTNLKDELDAIRSGAAVEVTRGEKESVELPPIVVRPQAEPIKDETPNIEGKISAINKDNNFVIIDLGEDTGIKVGDIFEVYREDKPIAVIEVIQTRKNISACDIKKETEAVKIGDTVR